MLPDNDLSSALDDNPRIAIRPAVVLTSSFALGGILICKLMVAEELTGKRTVEIDRYFPLLSMSIGERVRLPPVTTAETDTYCLSHTSAVTSPKRFSTRTRPSGGTSRRISSSR